MPGVRASWIFGIVFDRVLVEEAASPARAEGFLQITADTLPSMLAQNVTLCGLCRNHPQAKAHSRGGGDTAFLWLVYQRAPHQFKEDEYGNW
jgi:hypothetical protein